VLKNSTHDINCLSLTQCHDRKRWPTNGATCTMCDCACSAKVTTTTVRSCTDPNSGGSCANKERRLVHEDGSGAEDSVPTDFHSDEQPPSVPAATKSHHAKATTAQHQHHKDHAAATIAAKKLGKKHRDLSHDSSSDESDDDESSDEISGNHHHHGNCGNGHREHGEQCDGAIDDGWWSVCNDDCVFVTFWPTVLVTLLLVFIFVSFICVFSIRHVHHRINHVHYKPVMVCKIHRCPYPCRECEKTRGGVDVVVQQTTPATSSADSSERSTKEKRKKVK